MRNLIYIPHLREKELQQFLDVISTSRKRKDVMPWPPEKDRVLIKIRTTQRTSKIYKSYVIL